MPYKTKQGRFKPRNPGKYKGDPVTLFIDLRGKRNLCYGVTVI